MSTCCVCLSEFDGESAPILMIDPSGNPLLLCPHCAGLVDAIAGKEDSPERTEAIQSLAEIDIKSNLVAKQLSLLISHKDAPLSEEDAFCDEEELVDEEQSSSPAPIQSTGASSFYFYVGVGFLAAALVLLVLLKILV